MPILWAKSWSTRKRRNSSRTLVAAAALLLACALAWADQANAAAEDRLPDIILLSVDALRADHLGCYGYDRPTSPAIDAFAKQALVFDNAVCDVPLTNPSMGAMHSSLYPRRTGTHRNGLPMPEDVPLAPEMLRNAGYYTFCVQSNWTLKRKLSGLHRGYEVYEDDFNTKRWGIFKAERYADDVTDIALKLLEKRDPDRPFFAWIHYSDPHAPYRFHRKFNPAGKKPRKFDEVGKDRARYDSEVAYMDHHIGRLLKALPKDAYIIFVADHGESLHEHDYLGHGRKLYQPGLHIPLVIGGPGIEAGRTEAPARGIDVPVTLLGVAGLQPAPGMLGVDLLNGDVPAQRVRVVETYGGAVPRVPGVRGVMESLPPMLQGVVENDWKLIVGDGELELYNLSEDPAELHNLAHDEPKRVAALGALIEEWDALTETTEGEQAPLTEEDREALRAGGYM